jgi:hypothetical protein
MASLDEQRGRLAAAVAAGALTVTDVQEEVARIEAERSRLTAKAVIHDVPQSVDWDAAPEAVNAVLHALWSKVEVDTTLGTVVTTWRDPSLRRAVHSTSVE